MQVGERPRLPPNCPESLTSLNKDCWSSKSSMRPTFQDICSRLHQIRQEIHLNAFNSVNNGVKIGKSNITETQETNGNILQRIDTTEHKGDTSAKKGGNELVGMRERILRVTKAMENNCMAGRDPKQPSPTR